MTRSTKYIILLYNKIAKAQIFRLPYPLLFVSGRIPASCIYNFRQDLVFLFNGRFDYFIFNKTHKTYG